MPPLGEMFRRLWVCALALILVCPADARAQGWTDGVDRWAESLVGRSATKWVGRRVPFPTPHPRPESAAQLGSLRVPVRVHAAPGAPAERLEAVLQAAEDGLSALQQSGLLAELGDGGEGGSFERDLYLTAQASDSAGAGVDATAPMWPLDGARAFAWIDARLPSDQLEVCTVQALIEAQLLELDPAESPPLRRASAAYFAWLATGEPGCHVDAADAIEDDAQGRVAHLFAWLRALGARQDGNRGVFLADMWQLSRQRTWEGEGLRGSPHLLEAIAKTLSLTRESLEYVAADVALRMARAQLQSPGHQLAIRQIDAAKLPARLPPLMPPLGALDSAYAIVRLSKPRPGARLSVWSHGELGVRWALSATPLDAQGHARGLITAPVRNVPHSELHVELDPHTTSVLVSLTNVGNGVPEISQDGGTLQRSAQLTFDLSGGG